MPDWAGFLRPTAHDLGFASVASAPYRRLALARAGAAADERGLRLAGRSLAPEVVLRDAARGSAAIRYAYGLTHAEMARGRYAVGAGITGAVLATGQAFIVHLIDAEPLSCAALSSARSCRRKPSLSSPCQST